MQGLGSWNQFLKITFYRPVPPVSLEHEMPHSPPWTPFRSCWRSRATAAKGSVLQRQPASASGKGQFIVDIIFDLRPVAFLKDWDLFVNGEAFESYKMGRRLLFSGQVISNALWPYGLQHSSLPGPSLFPSLLKFISIKREMLSNRPTLCHLLPPIFPSNQALFQLIQFERDLGIVVNPGLEVAGQE